MGRRERRPVASRYRLYIHPAAWKEMKNLPGHIRHRVKRAVDTFASEPRPSGSELLDYPMPEREPRRLRIENWRIIYVLTEEDELIDVLAVRKRPPYDYEDLEALLERL